MIVYCELSIHGLQELIIIFRAPNLVHESIIHQKLNDIHSKQFQPLNSRWKNEREETKRESDQEKANSLSACFYNTRLGQYSITES